MSKSAGTSRRRLTDLGAEYWTAPSPSQGTEIEVAAAQRASPPPAPDALGDDFLAGATVSDHSTCIACGGQSFETYVQQRAHFATDVHKHNARRRARGRPPLTGAEFDVLAERLDTASLGSISASDDDASSDEDDGTEAAVGVGRAARARAAASSVKVEFVDPTDPAMFVLLHKVALPDQESLASLERRGGWAVFMSGGGHFAASIWDKAGNVVKHKTFHRYTSRAKQGGSQAAADAQGGRWVPSAAAAAAAGSSPSHDAASGG
jgi:hypothetical protein